MSNKGFLTVFFEKSKILVFLDLELSLFENIFFHVILQERLEFFLSYSIAIFLNLQTYRLTILLTRFFFLVMKIYRNKFSMRSTNLILILQLSN